MKEDAVIEVPNSIKLTLNVSVPLEPARFFRVRQVLLNEIAEQEQTEQVYAG